MRARIVRSNECDASAAWRQVWWGADRSAARTPLSRLDRRRLRGNGRIQTVGFRPKRATSAIFGRDGEVLGWQNVGGESVWSSRQPGSKMTSPGGSTPVANRTTTAARATAAPPAARANAGRVLLLRGWLRIWRSSTDPVFSMVNSSTPGSPRKPWAGR